MIGTSKVLAGIDFSATVYYAEMKEKWRNNKDQMNIKDHIIGQYLSNRASNPIHNRTGSLLWNSMEVRVQS